MCVGLCVVSRHNARMGACVGRACPPLSVAPAPRARTSTEKQPNDKIMDKMLLAKKQPWKTTQHKTRAHKKSPDYTPPWITPHVSTM